MKRMIIFHCSIMFILLVILGCEGNDEKILPTEEASIAGISKYMPTGMKWKEVLAEPQYQPLDTINGAVIYEIGSDVIVNGKSYKVVLSNGKPQNLWVREDGEVIWLLTEDYPDEIKLYDFKWEGCSFVNTEYLRGTDDGYEKRWQSIDCKNRQTCSVGGLTYEFIDLGHDVEIRGLGRVSALNFNSAILGCKIDQVPLPGLVYRKVLWVNRNGKGIFRSEVAEEWIDSFP